VSTVPKTDDLVIGVLALQGDVREHLHALGRCGTTARPVRRPEELDAVDALVIPGGESTTMSRLAVEFELLEPVRKRIAEGMPAYGSCAGMIMLATEVLDGRPDQESFGGIEMTVRRNAFGRQVDSFEAPVRLDGVPGDPFHAVFIRAPWVERVGAGVEVLARVARPGEGRVPQAGEGRVSHPGEGRVSHPGEGRVPHPGEGAEGRIVAVRQGNLLATAFHPELTGDLRVHRFFAEMAGRAGSAAYQGAAEG
jgi:5'-phosphate synthase pdxT subunit